MTLFLENGGTTTQPSRPLSAQSDTDEALARQLQESDVRAPIAPKTDILAGPSNDMFLPTTSSWHVPRSEPGNSINDIYVLFLGRKKSNPTNTLYSSTPFCV